MAAAIIDVYRALDQWAPFDTQMDFDNAGFLVGRGEREVREGPGVFWTSRRRWRRRPAAGGRS